MLSKIYFANANLTHALTLIYILTHKCQEVIFLGTIEIKIGFASSLKFSTIRYLICHLQKYQNYTLRLNIKNSRNYLRKSGNMNLKVSIYIYHYLSYTIQAQFEVYLFLAYLLATFVTISTRNWQLCSDPQSPDFLSNVGTFNKLFPTYGLVELVYSISKLASDLANKIGPNPNDSTSSKLSKQLRNKLTAASCEILDPSYPKTRLTSYSDILCLEGSNNIASGLPTNTQQSWTTYIFSSSVWNDFSFSSNVQSSFNLYENACPQQLSFLTKINLTSPVRLFRNPFSNFLEGVSVVTNYVS